MRKTIAAAPCLGSFIVCLFEVCCEIGLIIERPAAYSFSLSVGSHLGQRTLRFDVAQILRQNFRVNLRAAGQPARGSLPCHYPISRDYPISLIHPNVLGNSRPDPPRCRAEMQPRKYPGR
jgi:hypothetical protein